MTDLSLKIVVSVDKVVGFTADDSVSAEVSLHQHWTANENHIPILPSFRKPVRKSCDPRLPSFTKQLGHRRGELRNSALGFRRF